MIIDFHNHFYPPQYLEALKSGSSHYTITEDDAGNPCLHSPGDINIVVPGHRDIDFRQRVLEEHGIDQQVITFTAPGTLIEEPRRSAELARLVNDCLASIVRERPQRFRTLATLPLNDAHASLAEFDHVLNELQLPGAMLYGNANGTSLADERFWPIYEMAGDARAVLYIHPTYPPGVEAMERYWLMPLVGFMFDTTLAATALVFSGVVQRFPGIQWVLGHLGGAIPYLAERLDRGYEAFAECRQNITRPPTHFLKQFYYDTVNFDPNCLRLALDFARADHLLAGSDYPHQIGSLRKMLDSLRGLDVSEADRALILGENAARLLGSLSR